MIQRNPICVRMNDGQYAEDGDTIECIETKIKYNFIGEIVAVRGCFRTQSYTVTLVPKATYFSAQDICYVDDETRETVYITQEMRDSEIIHNPIYITMKTFINEYKVVNKWNCEDHRCLNDEESEVADALIDGYREKEFALTGKEWSAIYSEEAINKETFQ